MRITRLKQKSVNTIYDNFSDAFNIWRDNGFAY